MILLFDMSSMQPEDVQRAVDSATEYVDEKMTPADLVAVATIGTTLDVLTDFTGDARRCPRRSASSRTPTAPRRRRPTRARSAPTRAAASADDDDDEPTTSELDMFNNDVRLRAMRTLAETLTPIEQKKAIVYFSAGMQRSGHDNQVELRAAVNAAVRANVSIYPVDTRGLQAVRARAAARAAGGRPRRQARVLRRGVAQQFAQLASLAGHARRRSPRTPAGARSPTPTISASRSPGRSATCRRTTCSATAAPTPRKDGRFRRIQVRVKNDGAARRSARRLLRRARLRAHQPQRSRSAAAGATVRRAVSATDLPVFVAGGWFRLAADATTCRSRVAVPGSAVPCRTARTRSRSTCAAWSATSRGGRSAGSARR